MRENLVQRAQAAIKKQLIEGVEAAFFKGWGERIICADPGELLVGLEEALANLGCGIIVTVEGGPVPHGGEEAWDVQLQIFEAPALNRNERSDGKTAADVLDAVLSTFAWGGAFWPADVALWVNREKALYGFLVTGTCNVVLDTAPGGRGVC